VSDRAHAKGGCLCWWFFLELYCFFDLLTPEVDQILAELVMLSSNYDIIITLMVFPWWHSTSPLSQ